LRSARPASAGVATRPRSAKEAEQLAAAASDRQRAARILARLHARHLYAEMATRMDALSDEGAALALQDANAPQSPRKAKPLLKVLVLGATGLPASDRSGTSDPFCVCEIPGKTRSRCQTKVAKRTLKPEWNEVVEIRDFAIGDSIRFQVMDWDYNRSELLGEAVLMEDCVLDGFEAHLPLTGAGNTQPLLQIILEVRSSDGEPLERSIGGGGNHGAQGLGSRPGSASPHRTFTQDLADLVASHSHRDDAGDGIDIAGDADEARTTRIPALVVTPAENGVADSGGCVATAPAPAKRAGSLRVPSATSSKGASPSDRQTGACGR